ncbi:unnamed protein product [Symbiodinium microadriaticum]|nr:unnamed protein product [Symbiodinium microadriaticum]
MAGLQPVSWGSGLGTGVGCPGRVRFRIWASRACEILESQRGIVGQVRAVYLTLRLPFSPNSNFAPGTLHQVAGTQYAPAQPREACPTGTTELAKLREALLMIAQEKISSEAITSLLDEVAKGAQPESEFDRVCSFEAVLGIGLVVTCSTCDTLEYAWAYLFSGLYGSHELPSMHPRPLWCIEIDGFLDWLAKKEPKGQSGGAKASRTTGEPPHKGYSGFPRVNQISAPAEARFAGSIEVAEQLAGIHVTMDFRVQFKDDAVALDSLRGGCCNACGASLKDVQRSFSDNIFMGFIYGIAKAAFHRRMAIGPDDRNFSWLVRGPSLGACGPSCICLIAQTPDFLCFDDPLQCSSCHLNAALVLFVQYLFTDPSRGKELCANITMGVGLALILDLRRIAAEAALEQLLGRYWKDEARVSGRLQSI